MMDTAPYLMDDTFIHRKHKSNNNTMIIIIVFIIIIICCYSCSLMVGGIVYYQNNKNKDVIRNTTSTSLIRGTYPMQTNNMQTNKTNITPQYVYETTPPPLSLSIFNMLSDGLITNIKNASFKNLIEPLYNEKCNQLSEPILGIIFDIISVENNQNPNIIIPKGNDKISINLSEFSKIANDIVNSFINNNKINKEQFISAMCPLISLLGIMINLTASTKNMSINDVTMTEIKKFMENFNKKMFPESNTQNNYVHIESLFNNYVSSQIETKSQHPILMNSLAMYEEYLIVIIYYVIITTRNRLTSKTGQSKLTQDEFNKWMNSFKDFSYFKSMLNNN